MNEADSKPILKAEICEGLYGGLPAMLSVSEIGWHVKVHGRGESFCSWERGVRITPDKRIIWGHHCMAEFQITKSKTSQEIKDQL